MGLMFWYKTIVASFIFILIIICSDCRNNKPVEAISPIDTFKINSWKKSYDSLDDKYYSTRDINSLEDAGNIADSILSYETYLLKDSNQRKLFCDVLFNRSIDLNTLKRFIRSRDLLERYIIVYNEYKILSPEYLAYAQATLGNIYSRYGDFKKAALLLDQSMKFYTSVKDTESVVSCILNLSIPFKELQRYDEAEQTLKKIFDLNKLGPKRKTLACIELADIYLRQQKIEEAGRQLEKAKAWAALITMADTDPKGKTGIYSTLYKVEGDWLTANQKPLQALLVYWQSLDSAKIAESNNLRNREIGKTYISMGKALEQLKQYDSALTYYNKALHCVINIDTLDKFALPEYKDIYAENTIAEALYARANCIINRGMENTAALENAVSCFKLSFETESKLLNAFSYDASRMYLQEQTRKETEKAITVCYRLYQKTKDDQWATEAFSFAENNKAFVLAESIKRNTAASRFLQKDTLYKKIQLLRKNLAWIEIETGKQHFSGTGDTTLLQSFNLSKQKTEEELLTTESIIRLKNPQYTSWMNHEEPLSAAALIRNTIAAGGSFIEYFSGNSVVYAFSGEQDKPLNFYQLPSTVKNNTDSFLHFFADRNIILSNPAGYANAANTLYQTLLRPYVTQSSSSLLIIPDGFISYIPFDALLTGKTTSTDISSFPFLIRQRETYQAFSCKTLFEQLKYKPRNTGRTVAAFAPMFVAKERGLSSLIHSKEELEAIKEYYPDGDFYTGADATLTKYEKTSAHAGIIHLATHAGSGNNGIMAGIEFYDSTLHLNSIYVMPLEAKLVVLSGCETGTGVVNKAEGLMSLARGFSYAGTKNVIGSLWQTEDNTSAEIFKHFYSNLSNNNFSTALHKAKLAVINNATVTSASPFYWSGYIYIGSPSERLKRTGNKNLTLILLTGGLLLIIVYLFYRKKKN